MSDSMPNAPTPPAPTLETDAETGLTRRGFMAAAGTVAAGGFLASVAPATREGFFKEHFLELDQDEMAVRIQALRDDLKARTGRDVTVSGKPAEAGVQFGYALDLSRCVGCRTCVYACVQENNQSRDPQIHWIRVLQLEKQKGIDLEGANPYYEPPTVPEEDFFYLPVSCQQCRNPQCTTVCPVGATWQEPDGIVVIDYDWCIGCRCCMTACPYGARHFNWGEPTLPAAELNPNIHLLGNRPRARGVAEKCTFCIQRAREGRYPACVEACPVGARKFGNLLDPQSEISLILKEKRVFVLKAELSTHPKFFYYYG